jgi:transposase
MIRFIGLDVHKRVVQVCILDGSGQVLGERRFELSRERLLSFAEVSLRAEDQVVLEATTNTWAIVDILKPHVARVVVSNPLTTKAIAQAKVKTDKVDARVLAQLLRCDFLPQVWQPDPATRELRRWTGRRARLVGQATTIKNRLHAVFHQRLLVPPVTDLFGTKGRAWLRTAELDAEGRFFVDSDLRLLAAVEAEIAAVDQLLAQKGYADPRVKVLVTLTGVNVAVAQSLLAAWGDHKRFRDGDHAASYLGLVPSTKQSADHCYHGPITKAGRGHTRWMLIQAAQHVRLHAGPLGVFFRRLAKKKNHNVAVVAAARKLVVIAWHMLTKNEPYRYAQPLATESKLSRLRVKAGGQKRKSGPKPGTKAKSKLGPGIRTRTIKPLAQVLSAEGLPPLLPLARAEKQMIEAMGCDSYVADLARSHVTAKRSRSAAAEVMAQPPSDVEV